MYDTVSKQTFRNSGTGQFIVGFETTKKAAISLSKLPVTTNGTLTVSLPQEAAFADNIVQTALSIAAARGWTIITQYRAEFENEATRNKYAACVTVNDMLAVNPKTSELPEHSHETWQDHYHTIQNKLIKP